MVLWKPDNVGNNRRRLPDEPNDTIIANGKSFGDIGFIVREFLSPLQFRESKFHADCTKVVNNLRFTKPNSISKNSISSPSCPQATSATSISVDSLYTVRKKQIVVVQLCFRRRKKVIVDFENQYAHGIAGDRKRQLVAGANVIRPKNISCFSMQAITPDKKHDKSESDTSRMKKNDREIC